MTWDEPAASAGASSAVSYDLDLYIDRGADCTHSLGRCGEYSSLSLVDNVEYVIINDPPAGTYRFKGTPYNAPSSGLPASIAIMVIRGDPTPDMDLTTSLSTSNPILNNIFTVITTVTNSSYIAAGVHLELTNLSSGLVLQSVQTTRKDGINMDFGTTTELTLGNIRESDARSVTWTFKGTTTGNKTIRFRAWSENGGTETKTVNVTVKPPIPSTPSAPDASDGTYSDRVRISWSSVSGATTYKIYRCTNSSTSSCSYIASDSSSPYNDYGGNSGTIYYYRIKASNSAGDSGYSDYDTGYKKFPWHLFLPAIQLSK